MLNYFIHLGDATSQWFNTLFGGHPNESGLVKSNVD